MQGKNINITSTKKKSTIIMQRKTTNLTTCQRKNMDITQKKHKPSKNVNKEYEYNKHKERAQNPTIVIIKTIDLTMQRKHMNIT